MNQLMTGGHDYTKDELKLYSKCLIKEFLNVQFPHLKIIEKSVLESVKKESPTPPLPK